MKSSRYVWSRVAENVMTWLLASVIVKSATAVTGIPFHGNKFRKYRYFNRCLKGLKQSKWKDCLLHLIE